MVCGKPAQNVQSLRYPDPLLIGTSALGRALQNARAIEALSEPIFSVGFRSGSGRSRLREGEHCTGLFPAGGDGFLRGLGFVARPDLCDDLWIEQQLARDAVSVDVHAGRLTF